MPLRRPAPIVLSACTVLMLAACSSAPKPPTSAQDIGEIRPGSGILKGYLSRQDLPSSLKLLPPPPAPGSAAQAADDEAYRQTRALRDTPRWALARQDADLRYPQVNQTFACTLGVPVSEQHTPHLNALLRRSLTDAGLATYTAKDHYKRTRPFVGFHESTCTPDEEAKLRNDGSYPSGHTALGWATALILTELAPERADALLARGYAYGQSRVICGVHWQSDVSMGRVVGAAAVARLQADASFRAQMAEARAEIQAARAQGLKPSQDCAAEAAALQR